jgi:nucleoside-diphosphate-sugar epimerase
MAQSFTAERKKPLAEPAAARRRRVLVTGAAGNIGSYFAEHSHDKYDLRLMIRDPRKREQIDGLKGFGEVVSGDVTDLERMKKLCQGIDTVLHLAADPSPSATWESLLPANFIGTYNTFVAARSARCRRVVFASSIHAVSGYPADVQVKTNEPVNPGDLYGVSKCFGEALGRYMAEREGLSCIALRIGGFQPHETARSEQGLFILDAWVSRRDLNQLIERSIDVEGLQFAILHGLSDNRFKRMDITDARELVGYAPQDDLTEINPRLRKLRLDHTVGTHSLADREQKSGIREDVGLRGSEARGGPRGRGLRRGRRRGGSKVEA